MHPRSRIACGTSSRRTVLDPTGLPGERLIQTGLADLARDRLTPDALAVSVARERLRRLGIEVGVPSDVVPNRQVELALYARLVQQGERDPYARYNALLRDLSSFLEAAEGRRRAIA